MLSGQCHNQQGDGLKSPVNGDVDPWMTVRGVWGYQGYRVLTGCPEAFMAYDTCRLSIGLYLGSKHRFVFRALHLLKPIPFLSFPCFSQKIHCQSKSVTYQRSVRSTPSSPNLIRSLFSSVSDSIHSICFFFSFYSPLGKNLSFLHSSPFFQTRQS